MKWMKLEDEPTVVNKQVIAQLNRMCEMPVVNTFLYPGKIVGNEGFTLIDDMKDDIKSRLA